MPAPNPGAVAKQSLLLNSAAPLVLSGPPGNLSGTLAVRNSDDRYRIVSQPILRARLGTLASEIAKKRELTAADVEETLLGLRTIIVPPLRSRHVPISLQLDPATPPGTYEAALDVEGEVRPVVLRVSEALSFTLSPDTLIIHNRPGEKFHRTVSIENHGNLPLSIRSIGVVTLDDELAQCRALRGALEDVGDTLKSTDELVVALAKRYRKQLEFQFLEVKNPKTTIEPGQTAAVNLTISVSAKLNGKARFTGYAPVYDQNLNFTVVPD